MPWGWERHSWGWERHLSGWGVQSSCSQRATPIPRAHPAGTAEDSKGWAGGDAHPWAWPRSPSRSRAVSSTGTWEGLVPRSAAVRGGVLGWSKQKSPQVSQQLMFVKVIAGRERGQDWAEQEISAPPHCRWLSHLKQRQPRGEGVMCRGWHFAVWDHTLL